MFEYDVPKEKFGLQACSDRFVLRLPGMGEGSCIAFGVADARRRRAAGRWGTPSGGWPVAAVEHAALLVVASPTSNTEFHLKINGKLHFLKNFF